MRCRFAPKERQARAEKDAKNLKAETGACYLYSALAPLFGKDIELGAYRVYLAGLLKESGDPTAPLERMLVEQLAFCHHAVGHYHVKAAGCADVQEATAYTGAAARLMGEYRRSLLALKSYREPTSPPHLTLVRQ